MKLLWVLCSTVFVLGATTKALNINVSLSDGPGLYAGRVEVNYNGTWGSLCDTGLNIDVGHVICRQLGYPRAIATPCCNAFGSGTSLFWLSGVKCYGNESSLAECDYENWAQNTCQEGLDVASVVCATPNMSDSYPLDVRLSYAPVHYAGCVEVKYAGIWGDVGMFRWDQEDGRVVCRQLGYQDVLTVLWRCKFWLTKNSNVVTWMDTVQCTGNESSLTNCTHQWQTYRSSFGYDAGVVCDNRSQTDLQIRLNGALVTYAGRVEVLLAGKWGAIDRFTWQLKDAHVACKQLGFAGAELALRGATFILNASRSASALDVQWVDNVRCLGNESLLSECPLNLAFTPGPVLEAGVVCTSDKPVMKIRLAGSNVSYAGRVEVYIAGIWGTIRNRGWNLNASNVACRQLGYPGAETAILSTVGPYGKGEGPVWISDVDCEGREDSLWKCSWPRIAGIYWDHDNDAGVVCKVDNSSSPTNAPSTGEKANSSLSSALKIGLPVAGAVILLLLAVAFYFRCYRKERRGNDSRTEFVNMSDVSLSTESGQTNPGFQRADCSYHVKLDSEGNSEIDWCEISRERLSLGEKIGTDTVGATFHGKLCLENGNMTNCIVKTTKEFYTEENKSLDDVNDLLAELKILSCLGSHPNILNLFGACTIKGPTYLIFEDAEHGNLLDYLQQHQTNDVMNITQKVCTLSNVEKLRIALDVSKGMKHIGERKCIHKDVAARNIRLGSKSVAKVTNIGCSRVPYDRTFYEDISAGKLPAAKWMAPETLESMNISPESDIWSFGILLWEIETGGDVPYPEIQAKDLLQSLKSGHRMEKPMKSSFVIYEISEQSSDSLNADTMSEIQERDRNGGEEQDVEEEEPLAAEEDEGFHDTQVTAEEEGRNNTEKTHGKNKNAQTHADKRSKESSKPASSRASTHLDKKSQQMLAELHRLKNQMTEFQLSIHRPPVRPFTPDIFNSLSPYYNRYMVNSTIQDLQQEEIPYYRGYGHRPTALGVVDPEISWKLDNFPNPVPQSRLPGRLLRSTEWSRNLSQSSDKEGSNRLPPLPMPSFPKFNQSHYQPHRMTYDQVANFRSDLTNTYETLAEKQAKADYERTVQDWNRMNLSELKKLPPNPRYHIKKAIVSYLGTSRGSSRALKPLTKELNAATPTPISQP